MKFYEGAGGRTVHQVDPVDNSGGPLFESIGDLLGRSGDAGGLAEQARWRAPAYRRG
jgi:hypothetical protein